MEFLLKPTFWAAVLSLTTLEIALGIDNVIFQSLEVSKMPKGEQGRARSFSLLMSLLARPLFLCALVWFISLPYVFAEVDGHKMTTKTLTLVLGGLFLLWKSAVEIGDKIKLYNEPKKKQKSKKVFQTYEQAILQLVVLDIVCSFDSVIAAVGMSGDLLTMITALVLAVFLMMRFSESISRFILPRRRLQVLAFVFLFLIGLVLVAEGLGLPVSRPWIYLMMGIMLAFELPRKDDESQESKWRKQRKSPVYRSVKRKMAYAACAPAYAEAKEDGNDYGSMLASIGASYPQTAPSGALGDYKFLVDSDPGNQ